ncbi:hypothetical protein SLEP1_g30189 [Rubroshorea leprosula]|uniref:Uncharacterized protein n=1 Tax=Rubroshorea leprosula TaxID=152421 RepID=A0AAV5K5B9_9ROSI|nr:hypothetical protein SLEP1_g30189 [Rubroshorea leprosula]
MGRAPCCDKASVKKGPWSPEEDAKLKSFIEQHGTGGNWIALPQKIGLNRCGKSCRLRWLNYLRPNIKHGGFTEEEDRIICSFYVTIGSRWSIIAAQLPGRTDNDIKNYWNTRLKKKLLGKQRKEQQARRGKQHKGDNSDTNNNNQNPYWPELAPVYNNDQHQQVYEPQSVLMPASGSSPSSMDGLNNTIGTQFFDDRYNMLQGQSSFLGGIQEVMYSNPQRFDGTEFLSVDEMMNVGRLSLSCSESAAGGWGADMNSLVCPTVGSDFGGNGMQHGQAGMMQEYASFQ